MLLYSAVPLGVQSVVVVLQVSLHTHTHAHTYGRCGVGESVLVLVYSKLQNV